MKFVFAIFYFWMLASGASADFLKTGENVYQSSSKRSHVIVTRDLPGIFIVYGEEIDLQEFNPLSLKKRAQAALFIHVDVDSKKYVSLNIGKRNYVLKTFASLSFGSLKITIDNSNPYISIVEENALSEPAVLAFAGLSEVINTSGQEAVALLEANQLNQYRDLIKPLRVTSKGLELNGEFFSAQNVGLDLQIKNPCLEDKAIYVDTKQLELASQTGSDAEQKEFLRKILKQSKASKRQQLANTIRLSVDRGAVILFNYNLFQLLVLKKRDDLSTAQVPVCNLVPFKK